MPRNLNLVIKIIFSALLCASNISLCQLPALTSKSVQKKTSMGIELMASVLPKARIISTAGDYKLKSMLQSSYNLGLNYNRTIGKDLSLTAGFHFTIGKWNFYMNIPPQDLGPGYTDGRRFIESKELWGAFRLPVQLRKSIGKTKSFFLQGGLGLRYSGLMIDLGVGGFMIDSANNQIEYLSGNFRMNNHYKPWITLLAGGGRVFRLKNHNQLSVSLQADISRSYFLTGEYVISLPNKPLSTGIYKVNGSSLGLSVQYTFTGANKQLVMAPGKKRKTDVPAAPRQIDRERVLENYVFKGNHIQLGLTPLATLKARLKNLSGDYPARTSASSGLLLSLRYVINSSANYSFKTGAEAMILGRNFITSFSKNDFTPPLISDYNTRGINSYIGIMVLSLPLTAEKRWLYHKTKFLFAGAGLRLNFSLGYDFDSYGITLQNTSGSFYHAANVDVTSNNDAKPWISFPLEAGHSWLLKNNNLLGLSFSSNISFVRYVRGDYTIDVPGRSLTSGKYSSTGSFIGLSLGYTFTNANYRIQKSLKQQD